MALAFHFKITQHEQRKLKGYVDHS